MEELNVTKTKAWYKKTWVIILGVLFFPFVLLISPFLLLLIWKKKNWPRWVKISVSVIPTLWALFFVVSIVSSASEGKQKLKQAEENLAQANAAIVSNNIEMAKSKLEESIKLNPVSDNGAIGILKDIEEFSSEEYVRDTLAAMTEEDVVLLKNGQLNKPYFENESLNNSFIGKLKENIPMREKLMLALAEKKKIEEEQKKAELIKKEAEEQAAKLQKEIDDRNTLIASQFSAWDGSHKNLTKVIKESMNDPDSYEHDKTVYRDMKDHLIVQTTFRGKNGFGGVVKNTVTAKVSLEGSILEIIE